MNYEDAKLKAAREYAEGLFNPDDAANPEFSDSIDFYAMYYMDGAEWRRYNRKASDEDVEEAAKEYGRQNVIDPDDNQDVVEDIASVFQEGVYWYEDFTSINYQSDRFRISLLIGMFIAILIFLFLIFSHG